MKSIRTYFAISFVYINYMCTFKYCISINSILKNKVLLSNNKIGNVGDNVFAFYGSHTHTYTQKSC